MRLIGQANKINEYDDIPYDSVVLTVTHSLEEVYRIVAFSLYSSDVSTTLARYDSVEAVEYVMETLREENYNDRSWYRFPSQEEVKLVLDSRKKRERNIWEDVEKSTLIDKDTGFSSRVWKALRRAGYVRLDDLTKHTEREIMSHRDVGRKAMGEIKVILASRGLHLRTE